MDVSDLNALAEKIAHIEQMFGHIDILINNAGIGVRGDVVSMAVDLDVQVMLVNYFGAVAITKGLFKRTSALLAFHIFLFSINNFVCCKFCSAVQPPSRR